MSVAISDGNEAKWNTDAVFEPLLDVCYQTASAAE